MKKHNHKYEKNNFSIKKICLIFAAIMTLLLPSQVFATSNVVPSVVKGISVYSDFSDRAKITWEKVPNATKYRIYYKPFGQKKWEKVADVNGNRTSYIHVSSKKKSLKPGKKYTYTVRGYNKDSQKWGEYSQKGASADISTLKKNQTYYLTTFLDREKGGLSGNGMYWVGGTTKAKLTDTKLVMYSSFSKASSDKYVYPNKKRFVKYRKWEFDVTPQTKYYTSDVEGVHTSNKKITQKYYLTDPLRGYSMKLVVRNNKVIWMRFGV